MRYNRSAETHNRNCDDKNRALNHRWHSDLACRSFGGDAEQAEAGQCRVSGRNVLSFTGQRRWSSNVCHD